VVIKRSIRIARHSTSISLEAEFWDALKKIADAEGESLNQLVGKIDATRSGNLSSALRVYVLRTVQERRNDDRDRT
jgi:predicted DNA-binding ribbon-helix-helix protein